MEKENSNQRNNRRQFTKVEEKHKYWKADILAILPSVPAYNLDMMARAPAAILDHELNLRMI